MPIGACVMDDPSVIRSPTARLLGESGAIDEANLTVPEYVPRARTAAAAASTEMVAVDGLVPDDGDTASQGTEVVAVHDAVGFSAFVRRRGSDDETCGDPEPGRCTANTKPRTGASVATGGPFCAISTDGARNPTPAPRLETEMRRVVGACAVFGSTAKVTVAGKALPLPPETIVTPASGSATYRAGRTGGGHGEASGSSIGRHVRRGRGRERERTWIGRLSNRQGLAAERERQKPWGLIMVWQDVAERDGRRARSAHLRRKAQPGWETAERRASWHLGALVHPHAGAR